MFGIFKKKPPTALDAAFQVMYGNKREKDANLTAASQIAAEELLSGIVKYSEVQACAQKLFDGPIPYSTHDLAVSVSLNFFRKTELTNDLKWAQIGARIRVTDWTREGKVTPLLAQSFEEVLYKLYKLTDGVHA